MPEMQMTPKEEHEVSEWVREQKNSGEIGFVKLTASGSTPTPDPELLDIYTIGDEVLVLRTDLNNRARMNRIICSGGVARELEEAGILEFPKRPQQGAEDSFRPGRWDPTSPSHY